jgi:hypothetical protein
MATRPLGLKTGAPSVQCGSVKAKQLELTAGPGGWVQAQWRPEAPPGYRSQWRKAWFRAETKNDAPDGWKVVEKRTFGWEAYNEPAVPWAGKIANAVNASEFLREQLLADMDDPVPNDVREAFRRKKPGHGPLVRIERPEGRRLGPDFYRQVAAVYLDAVERGLSPRERLMDDTRAKQDTVASWIKRARRDGYLAEAEPGKVSGPGEKFSAKPTGKVTPTGKLTVTKAKTA